MQIKTSHLLKFIIGSVLGVFLFLIPLPIGEPFNIALGVAIDWLGGVLSLENFNIATLLAYIFICISLAGTILAYTVKPSFINDNPKLLGIFKASPVYVACRVIAFIFATFVYFDFGPEMIIDGDIGGLMFNVLITGLVPIFLILAFLIPILTDFGLMEFIGTLIKSGVRKLFTLPGRASIDLAASWFGSSAVSVLITRDQHEKGFYTGREAATIAANFSFVSLPFSFVVARTMGIEASFLPWYLIVCITCIILAIITPRIWPFATLKDDYLPGVGKQINEDDGDKGGKFSAAVTLAAERAGKTTTKDVVGGGLKCYLDVFMDLFPAIMTFGTLGLIVAERTPVFDVIATPMRWYLELLRVPEAAAYASATLIGFADMFLPAIIMGTSAPEQTRFILGALSIVQIVYMAETGILILKSKIPLGLGKLVVIFILRTIIGLPIIVLLSRLFMSF